MKKLQKKTLSLKKLKITKLHQTHLTKGGANCSDAMSERNEICKTIIGPDCC